MHWDGKMLPEDDNQKVDRLPVIVTDLFGTAKLLGVPQLSSGMEKQQLQLLCSALLNGICSTRWSA